MDRDHHSLLVARLLVSGVGLVLLGIVGTIAMTWLAAGASLVGVGGVVGSVNAPMVLSAIGLALLVTGGAIGLREGFQRDHRAPIVRHEGAYVIAVVVQRKDGSHAFELDLEDPADLVGYVHLELEQGRRVEFRTSSELARAVGEGWRGAATTQGRWLLAFEPQRPEAEEPR